MTPVLPVILGSMQADLARMDQVAMNVANARTAGFKREAVAVLPFAAQVGAEPSPAGASNSAPLLQMLVHTDQRPGALQATGRKLDLAIAGEGWFEVRTGQGLAYTRQGNFRLDPQGRLVTEQGHALMGLGGEVQLTGTAPSIDAAGRVFDAAGGESDRTLVAQLKIVQFEGAGPGSIRRLGDGLVLPPGDPRIAAEGSVQIRQGFLENSNVDPMQEMVQLLQTVRHMETMQKLAIGYDEMLASSIRRLGEGS